MRIDEIIAADGEPVFSFEFFPPKTDEGERNLVRGAVRAARARAGVRLRHLGRGRLDARGRRSRSSAHPGATHGLEAMAHFTCVGATVEDLRGALDQMRDAGIDNVLALRGDPPRGQTESTRPRAACATRPSCSADPRRVRLLPRRAPASGGPHPGADRESDLRTCREKVDAGVKVLITQLFFDNEAYFGFVEGARAPGSTSRSCRGSCRSRTSEQIKRFTAMCGATIPRRCSRGLERAGTTRPRSRPRRRVRDAAVRRAARQAARRASTSTRSTAHRHARDPLRPALRVPWRADAVPASLGRGRAKGEGIGAGHTRRVAVLARAGIGGVEERGAGSKTLPEAKYATAINFLQYAGPDQRDVMLVTGPLRAEGVLAGGPGAPARLDEITSEELRLQGDPPWTSAPPTAPAVDVLAERGHGRGPAAQARVDLARPALVQGLDEPRAGGDRPERGDEHRRRLHRRRAGPGGLRLLASSSSRRATRPRASTTASGCGPAGRPRPTTQQADDAGLDFGRPIIVTDLRDPRQPRAYPMQPGRPVPARRRDRVLARRAGRRQGHRLGVGRRRHARLLDRGPPLRPARAAQTRAATPLDPIPYAGGGLPSVGHRRRRGGFEHNAWRPVGATRRAATRATATASCCWPPRRTSARRRAGCSTAGPSSRSRR